MSAEEDLKKLPFWKRPKYKLKLSELNEKIQENSLLTIESLWLVQQIVGPTVCCLDSSLSPFEIKIMVGPKLYQGMLELNEIKQNEGKP